MQISRRDFLKYCGTSAAVLGLSSVELLQLEEALANPNSPTVLWLQGSGCTGCSVSFLNRISSSSPQNAADLLINKINLAYHPNLMAAAGESAVDIAEQAYNKGGYVLIAEGGVATAMGGAPCFAWSSNGVDVTFAQAVTDLASRAAAILCVGNCASWGGISATPPNPTGVKGISAFTGKKTINIAGCPPHPDWIVWAVNQILLGNRVNLDDYGRPEILFARTVHDRCPRKEDDNSAGRCLRPVGCRGVETRANCPSQLWNNGVNWCINANAACIGCTQPGFPGTQPFFQNLGEADD